MEWKKKKLEIHKLPQLNHKEIENLTGPITSKGTESIIKNLPRNKNLGLDGFTDEVYQIFKEKLTPILLKFFQRIEEKEILPDIFCDGSITLILKPDEDTIRKKNYTPISLINTEAKSTSKPT